MIEELAEVKSLRGEQMMVEVKRQTGCQACQMKSSCGTGSLGRLLGFKPRPLILDNEQNLRVGDRLIIGLPENAYLLAAGLVYIVPLVMMFVFAMMADMLFKLNDGVVALAACLGLVAGVLLVTQLSSKYFSASSHPRMIRRVW